MIFCGHQGASMSAAAFETSFGQFAKLCTEDYLVRYSNKGLYNRALKDISKGVDVKYAWGESSVSCELNDGTVCTLENTLAHWKCTCPSDSLCKHVLIAILFYAQQLSTTSSTHEEGELEGSMQQPGSSAERFNWLLAADLSPLIKPFNVSMVEEVLFRLRYPEELEVAQNALLTVCLKLQGAEVSFTEEANPAKALCKIKDRAGELLKLEALLRYRALKGLDDQEALRSKVYKAAFSPDTVRECKELIHAMLRTGLARLPQSYTAQLETLAVAARSGQLPDVERGLRGIQGELELFFNRHVRFSMQELLDRVTKLYLALELLERETLPAAKKEQLIGAFRSKYYALPKLRLYGLGAEPWETRSGYRGITYYMYGLDDQQVYTYSDARAVYYEGNDFSFAKHYAGYSPWLASLTMRQFAGEELVFEHIKVNEERRLSSGEGASLTLVARQSINEVNVGKLVSDLPALRQAGVEQPVLFSDVKERLALIKLARITGNRFDKSSQSLVLEVEDEAGEQLELILPYQADWEKNVKRLEAGYGAASLESFYAFVRIEGGQAYPISFLHNTKLLSLKLDT